MERFLPSVRKFSGTTNHDPDADSTRKGTPCTAKRPKRTSQVPSSSNPLYDIFISHAGEDKATIAIPLREKLRAQGINAFVDQADMQPGTDAVPAMIDAMETASVAVIILSPEFISRRWPMRELMCFLRRREECAAAGRASPIIIPFFYRLNIEELCHEPRLDRRDKDGNLLYKTSESKFYERQQRGEPEANLEAIKAALMTVRGIMGVRNDVDASNDSSYLMSTRRDLLLQKLCDKIGQVIPPGTVNLRSDDQSINDRQSQVPLDRFRKFFPPLSSGVRAVLDFDSSDIHGNPMTTEGRVKQHLLEEARGSPGIVSLHGIGGVGKSTILQALSVDHQIRTRFPDGIHVMKLGEDALSEALLRQIYRVLKESGAEKTCECLRNQNDMDEALRSFGSWFEGKRCAFLIDDVWAHDIGLGLLSRLSNICSAGENKVLITTREPQVASLVPGARTVRVEPREARGLDALRILLFHAGRQEMDHSSTLVGDSISRILEICAGLPVGLAAAGKNIRVMSTAFQIGEQDVWPQYLSELETCREELLNQDVGPYENLFATFATSIAILDKQRREKTVKFASALSFAQIYRRLCVLKKQIAVPDSMLKHLWQTESDKDVKTIARKLVESGLATLETVRDGEKYVWYLSLHDSLHDFAVAEAKRLGDTKNAHDCLLSGYKSCDREIPCEWWSQELETDGYIHRNVCRHLAAAGRAAELVQLLLSPQWVERQLQVNDILFLQADFALGVAAVQEWMKNTGEKELSAVKEALWLISEAVSLSSGYISSNIVELWFQVQGRLIVHCDYNKPICDYVAWIETKGARPLILCKSSFLGEAGGVKTSITSTGIPVRCMAMIDEDRVACGSEDGIIFVANVKRSIVENEWKAHEKEVRAIAVGRDGTRLISSSFDNTAKVWEVETGHVTVFAEQNCYMADIAVTRDGKRVISVSRDSTALILWNVETGNFYRNC